jgi:hypothetical protein
MSLRKINYEVDKNRNRIVNLDFLRGLFVILAMDQHFTYYINMWYVEYFRDSIALSTTYKIHNSMIGQIISTDRFNLMLGIIFTPWVSQVYLTMAAFNLARKNQTQFREALASKIKIFMMIFIFFVMENFIVAPNTGQAISFYPIMLWMIVLSIISIVYSVVGIRGVIVMFCLSLLRWFLPIDDMSNFFQALVNYGIHPGFEYDARIEYFFSSGCLGFIMGHAHYQGINQKHLKDIYFILAGIVLVAFWYFYGDSYIIDPSNAFAHEHDMPRTFSGTLYILGVQAIVISAFLWMERKNFKLNLPIFNWVGVNSILVFAFHRIFFVRMLAPISIMVGTWFGRPIGASTIELYFYVFLTIAVSFLIQQSRMSDMIMRRE